MFIPKITRASNDVDLTFINVKKQQVNNKKIIQAWIENLKNNLWKNYKLKLLIWIFNINNKKHQYMVFQII